MKLLHFSLLLLLLSGCSEKHTPQLSELEQSEKVFSQLTDTIIPHLAFENADVKDMLDFVLVHVKQKHPDIQYVITVDTSIPPTKVSLRLKNVSALNCIRYVTRLGEWRQKISANQILLSNTLSPEGSEFCYSAIKFPQTLLFDEKSESNDIINAKPLLDNLGVRFPDGAEAKYWKSRETLIIKNTQDQIDLINQLVDTNRPTIQQNKTK